MFFVRFFLEVIKIDLLGYNLCVTAKKFSQLLTEKFKEYDITPEQWVIVRILFENNIQLSQKELAIKSQKDQNTVTAIIDKLEKKGYVERVKSNEDKRIFNIILKEKIKKNIKEALFYPAIVFVFTIFLLIFMLTFVFPNFISLFQDTNTTLPLLTKIIIFLSQNIFYILLILSILILFFIKILKKLPLEKYQSFIFTLPFYGKIVKKNLIISLCQNFSIMNKAGINIIDILETLKKATPYIFLQKELQKIKLKIKIGNTIEEAFLSTNLFSSTEIKTISIGEKTGRLSEAFSSISFILQKDLESYLFKLTTLLQPFLLLILGIIIGIIVLAIYLPIFNITDLII